MINLAIQLLPMDMSKQDAYHYVDIAIEVIKNSGLKYQVCPFETVIEGDYDEVMKVVKELQEKVFEAGAEHFLINMKLQNSKDGNVQISDKMKKYQ